VLWVADVADVDPGVGLPEGEADEELDDVSGLSDCGL